MKREGKGRQMQGKQKQKFNSKNCSTFEKGREKCVAKGGGRKWGEGENGKWEGNGKWAC